MSKYILVNNETGEIVDINNLTIKSKEKITKQIVDAMLKKANNLEEIDIKLLAKWIKMTKQINDYGQIKMMGVQRDVELEKMMIKEGILYVYVAKILYSTHPFSCAIMKNRQTKISTWTELWELIECNSRTMQQKVKKFLIDNSLVREMVVYKGGNKKSKEFYLNPFLLRTSGYSSQIAINCFKDCAKESINVNSYVYRFLQCVGILDDYK